ncbi:MAG TPA: NAD(P)H-binding protein [Steroidobacteraceae bacterium]|nr:NAD(P)H-binding protein [Steroidobacteraceae bacterium]
MQAPSGKIAVLAGSTGLTGGHLLEQLLDAPDFTRVYALSRRPLGREHFRLANRIVQFDRLESQLKGLACHTAFCCLGTSLRAAGSEQACRRVRVGYVLAFARAAKAAQAERFVLLSCAGADPGARDAGLKMASEAERALEALAFPALDILQPGWLLGLRRETQLLDLLRGASAVAASPFLVGAREPQRAIPARTVAAAMLGAARSGRRGTYRYTYAGIRGLAEAKPAPRAAVQAPTTSRARPPPP